MEAGELAQQAVQENPTFSLFGDQPQVAQTGESIVGPVTIGAFLIAQSGRTRQQLAGD